MRQGNTSFDAQTLVNVLTNTSTALPVDLLSMILQFAGMLKYGNKSVMFTIYV